MAAAEPITVVVDTREQAPWVFSSSVRVVRDTVPTGADYTVLGYESLIGIERKSLQDLVGSLTQGRERFTRSLVALSTRRWRRIIVEAPLSQLLWGDYRSHAHPSSILGSVCSIDVDGIPVSFADDAGAAAQLAERWLMKAAKRAEAALRAEESVRIVDAPDRRETCAGCGRPYEPHVKAIVRELGGDDRSWHFACYRSEDET